MVKVVGFSEVVRTLNVMRRRLKKTQWSQSAKRLAPYFLGAPEVFRNYRYLARSRGAFVQQVAVGLVARGYFFYSKAIMPEGKDLLAIDRKLDQKYGFAMSKWQRSRLPRDQARVQYLRFNRTFVLLATEGEHRFFEEESQQLDIRRVPLKAFGYSISAKWCTKKGAWRPSVRLTATHLAEVEWALVGELNRGTNLEECIRGLDLLWFSPVRRQVYRLVKKYCEARGGVGEHLPRRRQVKVFQD